MTNFEVIMKEHPQFVKAVLAHCVSEIILEKVVAGDHEQYIYYSTDADKNSMSFLNAEYVQPVLDNIEKEYLNNVIRPFKHKVKYIMKSKSSYSEQYYIEIKMVLAHDRVLLPYFSAKSEMYKGMELNKRYTLKELGL